MGMLDIEFNLQHGQQAKYVYLAMCQKPGKTLVTTISFLISKPKTCLLHI